MKPCNMLPILLVLSIMQSEISSSRQPEMTYFLWDILITVLKLKICQLILVL
jgi:hypothetical protein